MHIMTCNKPGKDNMHNNTSTFIFQEEVITASVVFNDAKVECRRVEAILLLVLSCCVSVTGLVNKSS